MPRFSIKDLLLAITFVAAGLSLLLVLVDWGGRAIDGLPIIGRALFAIMGFGSVGALILAGLFAPFHKKAIGAGIGLALGGAFIILLNIIYF